MKTLSIKQPWASLICTPRGDNPELGIKNIENRTWATKKRERIYIHASGQFASHINTLFSEEQWEEMGEEMRCRMVTKVFYTSAIIGEVDIVDCVINHPSIWAEKTNDFLVDLGDAKPIYNWVLANPVLYNEPILNIKGKLSFWEYNTL